MFDYHSDRELLERLYIIMSATSDAIAAQTTALEALAAAVTAVPADTDDAANAAAVEANTTQIEALTSTLTGDEAPPSTPVSDAPVESPTTTDATAVTPAPVPSVNV